MITRLLSGILAAVFLPLGLVFTVIGLAADEADSGSPEDFLMIGLPFLATGVALAAVFGVLTGRARAARRRRREGARTQAQVVHAFLHAGVRAGVLLTYDLTVTFPAAGGEVTQRVMIPPNVQLAPGDLVEIAYDPAEPANFELAVTVDQSVRRA